MNTEQPQSPMQFLGEDPQGRKWYFADNSFLEPGIYYWNGETNVRVQTELESLRVDLRDYKEGYIKHTNELAALSVAAQEAVGIARAITSLHWGYDGDGGSTEMADRIIETLQPFLLSPPAEKNGEATKPGTNVFRKKPVLIIAHQFDGIPANDPVGVWRRPEDNSPYVVTIHDQRCYLMPGDWIIPEPDGVHYYPCKPDIFAATYDPASAPASPPTGRTDRERLDFVRANCLTLECYTIGGIDDDDVGWKAIQYWRAPLEKVIGRGPTPSAAIDAAIQATPASEGSSE